MRRREFVLGAAAAVGLATAARAWPQRAAPSKRDRISIMAYCFDPLIPRDPPPADPARTLDIMELPQMVADRYGVHNVEMQASYFLSLEPAYLRAFRDRVARARSRLTQVNLEFTTNLSHPELRRRIEAIELTKRWIDHAVTLGCRQVMVNQGTLAPELLGAATEALRTMRLYGESRKVAVTLENRGTNWEALARLIRDAGAYSNPDLGNFPDAEAQQKGIRALMPMNHGNVHVKLNPARYDLPSLIALTKQLGYTGLYSIEATSSVGSDPYANTQKIMDVLLESI